MDYEIKELRANGSGYMVVTLDNGQSFGQVFHNMPVDDPAALIQSLSGLAEERAQYIVPPAPKVPHRDVLASVSVKVPIDRNRVTQEGVVDEIQAAIRP